MNLRVLKVADCIEGIRNKYANQPQGVTGVEWFIQCNKQNVFKIKEYQGNPINVLAVDNVKINRGKRWTTFDMDVIVEML